jgi:hypothetical protein
VYAWFSLDAWTCSIRQMDEVFVSVCFVALTRWL